MNTSNIVEEHTNHPNQNTQNYSWFVGVKTNDSSTGLKKRTNSVLHLANDHCITHGLVGR
jgi:hypothetical protein